MAKTNHLQTAMTTTMLAARMPRQELNPWLSRKPILRLLPKLPQLQPRRLNPKRLLRQLFRLHLRLQPRSRPNPKLNLRANPRQVRSRRQRPRQKRRPRRRPKAKRRPRACQARKVRAQRKQRLRPRLKPSPVRTA